MNPKELKLRASQALESPSYSPKRLILIYMGVSLGLSILVMVANALLDLGIGTTGGLSGMNTRAILETAKTVLDLGRTLFLPFWQVGWIAASMAYLHREPVGVTTLWEGFRRFGPVLRLIFLQGIWLMGLTVAGCYGGALLFSFTPWGADGLIWMETGMYTDSFAVLLLLSVTLALVLVIPAAYKMRLSFYYLLDYPGLGALLAMQVSKRTMRGNCKKMLRVDLSFWWFYLLEVLCVVLLYSDGLWNRLFSDATGTAGYILAFVTSSAVQLLVYARFKPHMDVTYAACYEELIPAEWKSEVAREADPNP